MTGNPAKINYDNIENMDVDKYIHEKNKKTKMERLNFIEACFKVSRDSYFNFKKRLMINIPKCVDEPHNQSGPNSSLTPISFSMEESLKNGMLINSWFEVLDNCHMFLQHNPHQFLTAKVLKDIVEIILNAHIEDYSEHSLTATLDKCRMILSLSFHKYRTWDSTLLREALSIVIYCWNRLMNEMLSEALDEPIINTIHYTPEDMKQTVKGLFWQRQKFEIFETLPRTDRIDRLMLVLDSIIELLQLDLVIWNSHFFRHSTNLRLHMMMNRPLIAAIIWQDNNLFCIGMMSNFCKQIIRIFVNFVCLNYPKHHIKTVTTWVNAIVEAVYMSETPSNFDYPNFGMPTKNFAHEFYKIIKDLPSILLLKVLKSIKPPYMRYMIGKLHVKSILNTDEDNILVILKQFLLNLSWLRFPQDKTEDEHLNDDVKLPRSFNSFFHCDFDELSKDENAESEDGYPKVDNEQMSDTINQKELILLLYTTFEAFLESYQILSIENTIKDLNQTNKNQYIHINNNIYYISVEFVENYKSTFQLLKEIWVLLVELSFIKHLHVFSKLISL